jgi:hypothetical protein
MIVTPETHPLTEFVHNHQEHLARLKQSAVAQVLTVDGKAELVLQSAESYQALLERLRELENLAAIREGLAQADAGLTRPAEEFFSEFMQRRGIRR